MIKDAVHLGNNIRRIRELKGIKQEAFAEMMGVTQAAVSKLESTAKIDDERLKDIASKLGVSADAIKNFNADSAINFINTFNDNSSNQGNAGTLGTYGTYNFNPIDKLIELYERTIKEKNDEIEKLKQELRKK
jgi:transcriptional regulator with XRE-family HTH domain